MPKDLLEGIFENTAIQYFCRGHDTAKNMHAFFESTQQSKAHTQEIDQNNILKSQASHVIEKIFFE